MTHVQAILAAVIVAIGAGGAPICAADDLAVAAAPAKVPPKLEPRAEDVAAIAACVAAAGEGEDTACIGRVQRPCLETDGGETTAGSMLCAERERAVWAQRLDASLKMLEAHILPERLAYLHAAQNAWIEYQRQSCLYEASIYLGGSLGKVVAADCRLRETAARAADIAAAAREAQSD